MSLFSGRRREELDSEGNVHDDVLAESEMEETLMVSREVEPVMAPSESEEFPETIVARLERLELMTSRVVAGLDQLIATGSERQRYDEVRELQVRKLYDEVDEYKRGDREQRIFDFARRIMSVIDKISPERSDDVPLQMVHAELVECLVEFGIEEISALPGSLPPTVEQVVGFLEPDDDRAIVVVQPGYQCDGRVVRARQVRVRRGD